MKEIEGMFANKDSSGVAYIERLGMSKNWQDLQRKKKEEGKKERKIARLGPFEPPFWF